MSEYAQDELYKALTAMMAAKQAAAHALRCLPTSPELGEALMSEALHCEAILGHDLPVESQVRRVIDFADELRQIVDANPRVTYTEQEGCVSGSYETVLPPPYGYAYNAAATSVETFAEALSHVHCHLTARRFLRTLTA